MRASVLAVAVAVALASGVARADTPAPAKPPPAATAHREPTAGDLATARSALREGLALREKGDAAGALPRLSSAWDLVPTPITGFELAKTHMILGKVLLAQELFLKVVRMPTMLEESARSTAARDESSRLAKELEPRVPSLHVKLTLPPNATAVVRIDDETISMTGNEAIRKVDPGPHDVVAKAGDGPEQTIHVEVAEAEVKDVPLSPQWIAPKPAPVTGPGGQVIYVRATNPLTFVGFGIATGALIVTIVSTVVAINAADDAAEMCGRRYCPPNDRVLDDTPTGSAGAVGQRIDQTFQDTKNRQNFATVLAVGAAITGVVFGGIGAVFATRPIKEKVVSAKVRPYFSPAGAGLVGSF